MANPELVDVFYNMAVLRQLNVLHPETMGPIQHARARQLLGLGDIGAFIANQIDVGLIHGNPPDMPSLLDGAGDLNMPGDLDVAPPPIPEGPGFVAIPTASLAPTKGALASTSMPPAASQPKRPFVLTGWGWGIPRTSGMPEQALRLLLYILSAERHGAELERFPILSARSDVHPTWHLSRRTNEIADGMFKNGAYTIIPWPTREEETEKRNEAMERAFQKIILERGYLEVGSNTRISRNLIEKSLRQLLTFDGHQPELGH
jgi:hypothetical protein